MEKIKFSVLLSIYKKEKPEYLRLALTSIWTQTLKPDEIVIVKDGKLTDELDTVLLEFAKDKPVKFVINEQNRGLSYSLNKGLSACSYNLVARMDTDDICFPERFEKQIKFFTENSNIDIVGSYAVKIDKKGTELGLMKKPVENRDIHKYIWTNPFIHPTVMFRKDKILLSGGYNPNSGIRMDDYELWFRCAKNKLTFANLPFPLLYYRFFDESIKKRSLKVGITQFKVGFNGCKTLHLPKVAYIGITVPLIRSLLPYPFNRRFNNLMQKFNPSKIAIKSFEK
jgi:glycosyltransferase involved in cell wall biosynthesis